MTYSFFGGRKKPSTKLICKSLTNSGRQPDYTVVRQPVKIPVYETFADGAVLQPLENLSNPE